MVDNDIELTFDDLLGRPQVERYITLSCVSNPVGGDLVGNARWQGVLLKDMLDEAGVQPGATQIVSRSGDGWTAAPRPRDRDGRTRRDAGDRHERRTVAGRHGYPVRMVVPGLYGYVSATKWVTEIELDPLGGLRRLLDPSRLVEERSGEDHGEDRHRPSGRRQR